MNKRAYALDALRGYAIITMVLRQLCVEFSTRMDVSRTNLLRTELSDASLSGITWVDLVFSLLFCLQWVLLSLFRSKRFEKGDTKLRLVYEAIKRRCAIDFLCYFIQHFIRMFRGNPQDVRAWLLSILCFIILFPMFIRIPLKMPDWMRTVIKVTAYVIAIVLLLTTQYANERTFDVSFSNIIILLLANMAVFGSVIYIFTMQNLGHE
ncbi:DUF5009 domain-containing protein [Bacteroides ovatus]|nr:DUF5009 domain-containing protein [Bacteroides ovatus]